MRAALLLLAVLLLFPAAPAQAKDLKDVKAGFIYVSPVGDAGWSYAHDQGRKALEALGVKTFYQEAVAEGPGAEAVIRNMARKGYDVIFTTSYGYMDPTIKVAKEFPKTVFMHCSGFKTAPNVGTYFGRIHQAKYLSGIVAGKMTKTGKLGYVASFPIPEVIANINAFLLGARSVNPAAEVRVVWVKSWFDPATEKEASKGLIDVGCDVLAQEQDSPAPQEAAQERGVWSIGYNSDMSKYAPKAHLTAPVWNWAPMYVDIVKRVAAGTWKTQEMLWGIETGLVGLAPYGPMVPAEVRALADAKKAELAAGTLSDFAGPIKDQSGKERVAAGQRAADKDVLGMDWFVDGVVGSAK